MGRIEHTVLITVEEAFDDLVDAKRLTSLAVAVMNVEGIPPAELGVLVTDGETVRRLNREYAGEDEATDVLAFSMQEGEEFVSPDDVLRLGEVIISYPTALRQAKEARRPVEEEIAHLLVHGALHLLGYDHAEPADEQRMRAREQSLLNAPMR